MHRCFDVELGTFGYYRRHLPMVPSNVMYCKSTYVDSNILARLCTFLLLLASEADQAPCYDHRLIISSSSSVNNNIIILCTSSIIIEITFQTKAFSNNVCIQIYYQQKRGFWCCSFRFSQKVGPGFIEKYSYRATN